MRLEVYAATTRPLLEYYERLGLLAQIDGIGRPEEIQQRILEAAARQHGAAAKGKPRVILLKSPEEIALMHKASMIVAEILEELAAAVKPGITTEELDRLAEELTYRKGARPAFKGYKPHDVVYPKTLCVSVNDEIVHGIPVRAPAQAGRYRGAGLRRGLPGLLRRRGAHRAGG